MPGTRRRSRRRRRRRGGVNSFEQIEHGVDKVTDTALEEPDKFVDAISGELTGKETRRAKAKRKAKEYGGRVLGFFKDLKWWGGRRRTRRRRHHRHTRRCRHRRRHRHTKRCRHRRSRRRRRRR